MANIKISQLVLATPGPNSVFPFTDSGATFKGFVSGLTTNYVEVTKNELDSLVITCLLYTSPSPRDRQKSRMPSSA